jgi:hypothetical protein
MSPEVKTRPVLDCRLETLLLINRDFTSNSQLV